MKCRREGLDSLVGERRGRGRGKAHMSLEKEELFLNQFKNRAKAGELVTVRVIQSAHCRMVGKLLNATVTYRLLHRHRWRKIAPRPEHPKHNPDSMKRFREAIFPPGFNPYED